MRHEDHVEGMCVKKGLHAAAHQLIDVVYRRVPRQAAVAVAQMVDHAKQPGRALRQADIAVIHGALHMRACQRVGIHHDRMMPAAQHFLLHGVPGGIMPAARGTG